METLNQHPKVAVLGYGDIGQRLFGLFHPKATGVALSRRAKIVPAGFSWQQADARNIDSYSSCLSDVDVLVITLTPNERGDEAYRLSYVEPIRQLVKYAKTLTRCPLLLFVSSTAVYGQDEGCCVDDHSVTQPKKYNGQRMLQAEELLRDSGLPFCIVRFSGIYGAERKRLFTTLVTELRNESGFTTADAHWGNRIHVEDCARVLKHIIELPDKERETLYIASDNEPALRGEIKVHLAQQLGLHTHPTEFSAVCATGKRLVSKRLLKSGFSFRFPSFREGYLEQLNALDPRV